MNSNKKQTKGEIRHTPETSVDETEVDKKTLSTGSGAHLTLPVERFVLIGRYQSRGR